MCIIVTEKSIPSNTKLFNIPVVSNEFESKNLLIYTNNLSTKGVMIVAMPLESLKSKLYVCENTFKNIINSTVEIGESIFKPERFISRSLNSDESFRSLNFSSGEKAKILTVGDYKISIVYSEDDVLNRIDWKTFTMPQNIKNILSPIKELYSQFPKIGIVVAQQLNENGVKNAGFGIVYDYSKAFFPTCHEGNNVYEFLQKTHFRNLTINESHEYDVSLYAFSRKNLKSTTFNCLNNQQYKQNSEYLNLNQDGTLKLFSKYFLENEKVTFKNEYFKKPFVDEEKRGYAFNATDDNGYSLAFTMDESSDKLYMTKIRCNSQNQNVIFE